MKSINLYLIAPLLVLGAQPISAMTDDNSAVLTNPTATPAPASRHVYTPEQEAAIMGISIGTKHRIDWADSELGRCIDRVKQRHNQNLQEEQAWREKHERTIYAPNQLPKFQKMRYEHGLAVLEESLQADARNCGRRHGDDVFRAIWSDNALLTRRLPAVESAKVAALEAEKTACEDSARKIAKTGDSHLPSALGQWRTQRKLATRL